MPRPDASLRLVCFPHAGAGAATFREWPSGLPAFVDVWAFQAPGRGWRVNERPYRDLDRQVDAACEALRPVVSAGHDWALFGHSMGAVVSFEVASRLEDEGLRPSAVFVSGRRSPSVPGSEPPLVGLSDAAFVEAVQTRYGGIPDAIRDEPELLRLLLPTLRADVEALSGYEYAPERRVRAPLYALAGAADPTVTHEELARWRDVALGEFATRLFPGEHFFVDSARARVLDFISGLLRPPSLGSGTPRDSGRRVGP